MKTTRLRSRGSAAVSNSRWVAYAAAGAATTIAGIGLAEADISYSGPINQPFNGNQAPFSLGGPNAAFSLIHQGQFAGFFIYGAVSGMFRGSASGDFRYPSRLGENVNVSIGNFVAHNANYFATLATNYGAGYGNWLNAGEGFIGFKFDSGAGTQYGWLRLVMDGSGAGNTFTLVDYAFADPGEMIATGQVPEPGSLALLAAGAAGLLIWRKRRGQAAA